MPPHHSSEYLFLYTHTQRKKTQINTKSVNTKTPESSNRNSIKKKKEKQSKTYQDRSLQRIHYQSSDPIDICSQLAPPLTKKPRIPILISHWVSATNSSAIKPYKTENMDLGGSIIWAGSNKWNDLTEIHYYF